MGEMLTDIWILLSGALLLVGLGALPYLVKRARAVAILTPGRVTVNEPLSEDEPVPVLREAKPPEAAAPAEKPAPAPTDKPAPAPVDPADAPTVVESKRKEAGATTTGGISPAVVYMQNLKIQMEHFEKEIHQLRSQMLGFTQNHDKEFKLLLQKIAEFQSELHQQVSQQGTPPQAAPKPAAAAQPVAAAKPAGWTAASKPAAAPAPAPAPAAPPKPAAAAPALTPVLTPAAAPALKLAVAVPAQSPSPGPKPAAAAPAPAPKPAAAPPSGIELGASSGPSRPDDKTIVMGAAPAPKAAQSAEQIAEGLSFPGPANEPPPDDDGSPAGSKGPVWPV